MSITCGLCHASLPDDALSCPHCGVAGGPDLLTADFPPEPTRPSTPFEVVVPLPYDFRPRQAPPPVPEPAPPRRLGLGSALAGVVLGAGVCYGVLFAMGGPVPQREPQAEGKAE